MFHVKYYYEYVQHGAVIVFLSVFLTESDKKTSFSNCYFWIADIESMEAEKGIMGKG